MKKKVLSIAIVSFILVIMLAVISIKFFYKKNIPIIFITIDTIRDDYISCYPPYRNYTPYINEFAKEAVVFMNSYSPVPQTLPSHASIFTGLYPNVHGVYGNSVYRLRPEIPTLATLLKKNNYQTAAVVAAYILHSRYGLANGFDTYNDNMPSSGLMPSQNAQITADEVSERTIKIINSFKSDKFFIWIHYFDPHLPYTPPIKYREKFANPYAGEVAFVDDELNKLFTFLKQKKLYNSSIIIIVGDHGESLGEHGEYGHKYFLYNTTLRVPLLIKFPHSEFKGEKVYQEVITIDILPTLCDYFRFDCSAFHFEGKTLLPIIKNAKGNNKPLHDAIYAGTKAPEIDFGWAPLSAIFKNGWKYIDSPQPELYNYINDPKEENNLFNKNKDESEKLLKTLKIWLANEKTKEFDSTIRADSESVEKLIALGYIGASKPHPKTNPNTDVKNMKITLQILTESTDLLNKGKHLEAINLIENEIKRLEANNTPASFLYAIAAQYYAQANDFDKAIYYHEKHLALVPDFPDSYIALAQIYRDIKHDYNKAIDYLKIAITLDDKIYEPFYMLANLLVDTQRYDEANNVFTNALKLFPDNYDLLNAYARLLDFTQKYNDAIAILNKASQLQPDKPDAFINLAIVYYDKGEIQTSFEYIQKALNISPNHTLALQVKNTLIEPALKKH